MQDNLKLLFLSTAGFQPEETLRGAALVTDKETKPLEFRCTSAIRPSSVQKILYGSTLETHMKVELIAQPLLKAVKEKPNIIIVDDGVLLDARPQTEICVIKISENEEIDVESGQDEENSASIISDDTGRFKPVVLESHRKFESDKEEAMNLLRDVFEKHSIIEPFERISAALEQVHKQQVDSK